MKRRIINNVIISLIASFLFSTIGKAQNENSVSIGLRVPVQFEFQTENIAFPVTFESKRQRKAALNYGIDLLIQKQFYKNQMNFYIGVGYFRNKYNFKKFYDHELLNRGIDSLPIGTSTRYYVYDLARFPIGLTYKIGSTQRIEVGGEIIFNYSFQKKYFGTEPFPDANNKVSDFDYSGNSINLFANIPITINSFSIFELEPYVRVFHTYKKDIVLYDDPSNTITRCFNAFGLSFRYFFNLK